MSKDNLYLNITIPNTSIQGSIGSPSNVPAIYDQTLTVPVLSKPSEYYATIVRFSMPLDTIPIFSMPLDIYQNNPNISTLIIGIEVAGIQYPINVTYVPSNNLTAPNPAGSSPYFSYNDIVNQYYFIFSIQAFIDMVNTALAAAVTASGIGGTAPYYIYNSTTEIISIIVDATFLGTGATIFLNNPLKTYLTSFRFDTLNNPNTGAYLFYHNFDTLPYGSPSGGPYQFDEEYTSLALWYDIRKIVVTSSLPTQIEASPAFFYPGINNTANYTPIITDFSISYSLIDDTSTILVYNPSPQYRLIDLNSDTPLSRINITFYWLSKNGYLYNVLLSPNQSIEVKLGFFKKSMYNNNTVSLR